jgi:hypothetical protein
MIDWGDKQREVSASALKSAMRAMRAAAGFNKAVILLGSEVQKKLGLPKPALLIDSKDRIRDTRGRFVAVRIGYP